MTVPEMGRFMTQLGGMGIDQQGRLGRRPEITSGQIDQFGGPIVDRAALLLGNREAGLGRVALDVEC